LKTKELQYVLDQVKIQLKGLDEIFSKEHKVFLIDEVVATTSKCPNKKIMEDLFNKVVSLICSKKLQKRRDIPQSWYSLLEILRKKYNGRTSIKEASEEFAKVQNETEAEVNISATSLDNLRKLCTIIKSMDQESMKCTIIKSMDQESMKKELTAKNTNKLKDTNSEISIVKSSPGTKVEDMDSSVQKVHHSMGFTKEEYQNDNKVIDEIIFLIFEFFTSIGEVLWFKMIEELKDILILVPMELIKAMRKIISHKVLEFLFKDADQDARRDLEKKGKLSFDNLKLIYERAIELSKLNNVEQDTLTFNAEQIWNFLIQLKIACRLDENQIFLPCLISEKWEEHIRKEEENMTKESNSMCVEYSMDISKQGIGMFYDILSNLAKFFMFQRNGEIIQAFSQKIKKRKLGNVGGIHGRLRWTERDIRNPESFSFLLLEYDTDFNNDEINVIHAVHKGVRIHIKRNDGKITSGIIEILYELDKLITKVLPSASRKLICKECNVEDRGYFLLNEAFEPDIDKTCGNNHTFNNDFKNLFEKMEPFCLNQLMKRDKESLDLEEFQSSSLKRNILDGTMEKGTQIWIYHDKTTNPCNPLTRLNKYAHVVIYIGKTEGVHEVVHVSKDTFLRALRLKTTIVKQDIEKVIMPDMLVFSGHRIAKCQNSANIKKKIVARAEACVDPKDPKIIFHYDHR